MFAPSARAARKRLRLGGHRMVAGRRGQEHLAGAGMRFSNSALSYLNSLANLSRVEMESHLWSCHGGTNQQWTRR